MFKSLLLSSSGRMFIGNLSKPPLSKYLSQASSMIPHGAGHFGSHQPRVTFLSCVPKYWGESRYWKVNIILLGLKHWSGSIKAVKVKIMLPANHFLLGGYISSVMAVLGTVLNLLALWVLVDKKLRSNPTTILVAMLQNVMDPANMYICAKKCQRNPQWE